MALLDPWGHDGLTYDGKEMRLKVAALSGGRAGVAQATDYVATPQGSPNNTVSVSAGTAIILATAAGLLGAYEQANDAALTSPTFAATGANGRWDLLILKVVAGVPQLAVVQGTASGSPSYPSLAGIDNVIVICGVKMPANKSIIDNGANGTIEDRRSMWMSYFVCTSTTRPPIPFDGQMIEEQDTERVWIWDAANAQWAPSRLHIGTAATLPAAPKQGTPAYVSDAALPSGAVIPDATSVPPTRGLYIFDQRWDPPWNLPWGVMGYVETSTAQTGISTVGDLTTLTLSITARANRRWMLIAHVPMAQQSGTGYVVFLQITDGTNALKAQDRATVFNVNEEHSFDLHGYITTVAGLVTYKVRGASSTASTWQTNPGAGNPCSFAIIDIGPNGQPA